MPATVSTFQGLRTLCEVVSIKDLKNFRMVCRAWNDQVALHPRYKAAEVKMGNNWFRQTDALQLGRLTKWNNVKLEVLAVALYIYLYMLRLACTYVRHA
jgi:hypothetical protein